MAEQTTPSTSNRFSSSLSDLQEANHNSIIECMHTRLLSLEEAVERVTEFIPDGNSRAATAKRHCRQNSSLTINESAAIYLYTMVGPFYPKLNEALRAQNPLALKPWFPFLNLFLTALHKLPSCSTTVWRGVGEKIGDEFGEGAMHTWSSVNSCSSRVNVAGCFAGLTGTLFCIHIIRGKDITKYAAKQDEQEIVLLPETRLRVKSTLMESNSLSVVNLEECEILPEGKHVMLSCHSSNESIVTQIRSALEQERIPVWFEGPADAKDDMYDNLVEGVENAAIVCCFISSSYEESDSCQLELQYAHKRGKRVIMFMLCSTQSWNPRPWLNSIMTDMERINYYDDCEPNIHLGATGLIIQIKKKSPVTQLMMSRAAQLPSYLYELVKRDYKQNSRIERFMNPSQSFSIEQSYINLALVDTEEHQKKENQLRDTASNIAVMDKFEQIHGTKTRIDIKDIFKTCKNNENKVLVFGRAGIGKSTFCRYVAHQWACGAIWSEYDLVALIPLRSLTDQNYPPLSACDTYGLIDVLRKTCFCWHRPLSAKDEQLLQAQLPKSRILWLLDGYDEIVQSTPPHLQHLRDQLLRAPHHIVTSRPYLNTLSYKVRTEIIGFTDEDIPRYIRQFFNQVEAPLPTVADEETKILNFLKLNPRIWGIAHIPINLELICSVWSNIGRFETKTITVTILYEKLSEWICRRYLEKQRNILIYDIRLMDQQEVFDNCKKELRFLESLAFRGIEKNCIILPSILLADAKKESQCSSKSHPHLLNIGLLKSLPQDGTGSQVEVEKEYYFVHLSFQEYFAARYLLHALQYGPRQKAIDFIQRQKYNRRFTLLLRFVSGLAVASACVETMKLFWKTVQSEPVDLIGIRHIQLVMTCFDEVLHHEALPNYARFLSCIQRWIEFVVNSQNLALHDHLTESLQTCTSITNEEIVQKTLIQLLSEPEHSTKTKVLELVSTLSHLNPTPELLCTILKQLETDDTALKQDALDTIGSLGDRCATSGIIDAVFLAFRDDDPRMRSTACRAFGTRSAEARTSAVIDRLILAQAVDSSFLRRSASDAIVRIGQNTATSAVLDRLVLALGDEDSTMRWSVCEAIGRIGEKAATNDVLRRLVLALSDESSDVRRSAYEALGRIGDKAGTSAVLDRLVLAMADEDSTMRSSACDALGRIGDKAGTTSVIDRLIFQLGDEASTVRWSAYEALGTIGDKAGTSAVLERLILALGDEDSSLRWNACDALGRIGEKAGTSAVLERLVLALGDEDSSLRWKACDTLGKIGEKAGTSAVLGRLVLALTGEDSTMRWSVCEAIRRIGEKAATTAMIDGLVLVLSDESSDVRRSAYEALGRIGDKAGTSAVLDRLVLAMADEDPIVRGRACEAVGWIGEKAATCTLLDRLVRALGDESSDMRSRACEALRGIGNEAATSEVIRGLLVSVQSSEDWMRARFWKTLAVLFKLSNAASVCYRFGELLRRYSLEGTSPLLHVIWTIAMVEGMAVFRDGNKIHLYNDGEAKVSEVVNTNAIEELVKEFKQQSVKVVGVDQWNFSWTSKGIMMIALLVLATMMLVFGYFHYIYKQREVGGP